MTQSPAKALQAHLKGLRRAVAFTWRRRPPRALRQQLLFSLLADFEHFSVFRPGAYNEGLADVMFDQLEAWAGALKQLRADSAAKAA